LPLCTSWSRSLWVLLVELLLNMVLGYAVENKTSFENDGIYVHLNGSAE